MANLENDHAKLLPLLKRAKRNRVALTLFIKELGATGEPDRIARKFRNPDLDENEVIAEWYTQAALAAQKAKLDIGDPIHFIKWRAQKRVLSFIRSFHIRNLVVDCNEPKCGIAGQRLAMTAGMPSCAACGSGNVTTTRRTIPVDRPIDGNPPLESTLTAHTRQEVQNDAIFPCEIDDMRRWLFKKSNGQTTRYIQLFEAFLTYPGDRTYAMKLCAETWGVAPTTVQQALRRLKEKLLDFFETQEVGV